MFWLAPMPRFRIYTRATDYLHVLWDFVRGQATKGDANERLERAISDRFDVPYALCVPQGRVGIYLAVKHTIQPGQKVVLSPYTIADVINMVICAGGRPVFADIDRPTTNIRADEVERLIDADTGAVMVTHLHGMACEIEEIAEICRRRGVPLIEDAAQSFGARVNGRAVGTFGDVGVFSFGMYKNVTAFYGGMIVTRHEALHRRMKASLDAAPYMSSRTLLAKVVKAWITDVVTSPALFKTVVYWLFRFGHLHDVRAINKFVMVELDTSRKTHLPETYLRRFLPVQSKMVLRQLDRVDSSAAARIEYARLYHEGLGDIPELITAPFRADGSYVYNYFPVQFRDRAVLVRWAMQHRRDMAVQHLKNCASLPGFAPEYRDCPNAELTAAQTILLPNYPSYGAASVRRNIAVLRAFFAAGAAQFDERDIEELAALHISCLGDSDVAALGAGYVRSFYRYVTRSAREIALVERNAAGRIVAAAVITLDPDSFRRRLLLHTPLLRNVLRHAPRMLARAASRHGGHESTPEMILIYTSPQERGRGRATALVRQAEDRLRRLRVREYRVKTIADPANPALDFYRKRNFTPAATSLEMGRRFQVFSRTLAAE